MTWRTSVFLARSTFSIIDSGDSLGVGESFQVLVIKSLSAEAGLSRVNDQDRCSDCDQRELPTNLVMGTYLFDDIS